MTIFYLRLSVCGWHSWCGLGHQGEVTTADAESEVFSRADFLHADFLEPDALTRS